MTFTITKPGEYRTRGGKKAVVLGKNPSAKDYTWIGYIGEDAGLWHKSGECAHRAIFPEYDIISEWREPVTVEMWVSMYSAGIIVHYDEHTAKHRASSNCLATRKIRYTEGGKIEDVTEESGE